MYYCILSLVQIPTMTTIFKARNYCTTTKFSLVCCLLIVIAISSLPFLTHENHSVFHISNNLVISRILYKWYIVCELLRLAYFIQHNTQGNPSKQLCLSVICSLLPSSIPQQGCSSLFHHSSIDRHFGSSQFFAITDKANICVGIKFFISLG